MRACLVVLLTLLASPSWAANVSLGWRGFPADVTVQSQTLQETLRPTVVPWSDSHVAQAGGGRSEASYVLTNDGFYVALDQVNVSTDGGLSAADSTLRFTVDEDVNAVFAGQYDMSGPARRVFQRLILIAVGTGEVYVRAQESRATANESFTLGLMEGDSFNHSIGADRVRLIAGAEYLLFYDAFLQVLDGEAAGPATASGFFSMSLPEPGTALLVVVGLTLASHLSRREQPRTSQQP